MSELHDIVRKWICRNRNCSDADGKQYPECDIYRKPGCGCLGSYEDALIENFIGAVKKKLREMPMQDPLDSITKHDAWNKLAVEELDKLKCNKEGGEE